MRMDAMNNTLADTGLTRGKLVSWRNAVFICFGVFGISLSSWVARLPTVRDTLGASTVQMGLLVLSLAVGSILGLLASSHLIARLGSPAVFRWFFSVACIGFALAGVGVTVGSYWLVLAGLGVFGAMSGVCDVAMNVSGAANERALGRAIMPVFHAFFSVGTIAGAALGALAELGDVPLALQNAVIAVLVIVTLMIATRALQHESVVETADTRPEHPAGGWRERVTIWRDPRTIIIGIVVLGMAFAEGSANDWLALAMVDGHGFDNTGGAIVFGVFVGAMTVGRLAGVRLLDRFGRVVVLRASGVLATIGLVLVIFVQIDAVAIAGVICWGLGSALGFPVGISAAADDPRNAAARVSAVTTIGYLAFLAGPPLIGFLGEHFGLLLGLLPVLVLVAVSAVAVGGARELTPASRTEDAFRDPAD